MVFSLLVNSFERVENQGITSNHRSSQTYILWYASLSFWKFKANQFSTQ